MDSKNIFIAFLYLKANMNYTSEGSISHIDGVRPELQLRVVIGYGLGSLLRVIALLQSTFSGIGSVLA